MEYHNISSLRWWTEAEGLRALLRHCSILLRVLLFGVVGGNCIFLAYLHKVGLCHLFPVCMSPLSLLGNGISSSKREGLGLWVQALWMSRAADLLLLPLRRRLNIVCVERLHDASNRTEVRTLSVKPVKQRRWPLLDNSSKQVTVITTQRPFYYCVCVGKSKCFFSHSPIVARHRLDKHVTVSTYTPNNRRIVGRVVLYVVSVVSKNIRRFELLLGRTNRLSLLPAS
jgi:hypothetical protein